MVPEADLGFLVVKGFSLWQLKGVARQQCERPREVVGHWLY